MRWNIHQEIEKKKTMMFIIDPRYCGGCLSGFCFCLVYLIWDEYEKEYKKLCPQCGEELSWTKEDAFKKLNEKLDSRQ